MLRESGTHPEEYRAASARPDDVTSVAPGAEGNLEEHATVLPAPLTAALAALIGGALGLAAVYGVAERLADTVAGVVAVVMIFAVTLTGPRVHAGARTEVGRALAVALQSVGFGGVLGALIILT